jgi:hypothetical protein
LKTKRKYQNVQTSITQPAQNIPYANVDEKTKILKKKKVLLMRTRKTKVRIMGGTRNLE